MKIRKVIKNAMSILTIVTLCGCLVFTVLGAYYGSEGVNKDGLLDSYTFNQEYLSKSREYFNWVLRLIIITIVSFVSYIILDKKNKLKSMG